MSYYSLKYFRLASIASLKKVVRLVNKVPCTAQLWSEPFIWRPGLI